MNIQSGKGDSDSKKPKESLKDMCPVSATAQKNRAVFCIPVCKTPAEIFGLTGQSLQAFPGLKNPHRVGERGDYSGFQTLEV